ncbi:MAG: FeoB-associated Cys-rich membrane protein [Ruminococcus sp.]|nr:FeoB-associated Cys-rich membrane protein [Ruminococcus sp.]
MLAWLSANLGTIIVSIILLLILSAAVMKLIKDRKSGKSSCGCGCAGCAMHGACAKQRGEREAH